jgi:HK97 family phage major capsid protein
MKFNRTTVADAPPEQVRLNASQDGLGLAIKVDAESRVIRGFAVITAGVEALGHGEFIDDTFAQQVVSAGNHSEKGVKVRFTHPGLSADGLGTMLGRAQRFRLRDGRVLADLHFIDAASDAPERGDIAGYVMKLAEEAPEHFGASIVFSPDLGAMEKFSLGNLNEEGEFESPDERNTRNLPHSRLSRLWATDIVDEPAANPAGMFSFPKGSEIAARAEAFVSYALGLSDVAPPEIASGPHPDRAKRFIQDYLARHGLKIERAVEEQALPPALAAEAPVAEPQDNKTSRVSAPSRGASQRRRAGKSVTAKSKGRPSPSKLQEGRFMDSATMAPEQLEQSIKGCEDVDDLRSLAKTAADNAKAILDEHRDEEGRSRLSADDERDWRRLTELAAEATQKALDVESEEREAITESLVEETAKPTGGSLKNLGRVYVGRSRDPREGFSIARYMRGLATGKWTGAGREQRMLGMRPDDTELGGAFVHEETARDVIQSVKENAVINQIATVKTLNAMASHFAKITEGAESEWIGPGNESDITESQIKTAVVELRKKTLAVLIPVDNQLLNNATPEFEAELRNEIIWAIVRGVNVGGLFGTGVGPQPQGIVTTPGISGLTTTTLANLTIKMVKAGAAAVRKKDHECDFHVMTSDTYDKLADEETTTGAPKLIPNHNDGGVRAIGGVPVITTNLMRYPKTGDAAKILSGERESFFVGYGTAMALDIDKSVGFKRNQSFFRALIEFDSAVARKTGFVTRPVTALDA